MRNPHIVGAAIIRTVRPRVDRDIPRMARQQSAVGLTLASLTAVSLAPVGLTLVGLTPVCLTRVGLTPVCLTLIGLTLIGLTQVGLTPIGWTPSWSALSWFGLSWSGRPIPGCWLRAFRSSHYGRRDRRRHATGGRAVRRCCIPICATWSDRDFRC